MPEDANNNHRKQPDILALPLEPWSMEAEADRLMEDLFEEVDRVLDGGTALPKEPVQPEYLYLQPMDMQSIGLPLAPHSPQESLAVSEVEPPVVQRTPEESALTEKIDSSEEIESVTARSEIDSPIAGEENSSASESRRVKPVGDVSGVVRVALSGDIERSVRKLLLLLVSTCLGVPLLLWLARQGVIEGQGWQSLFVSGRDVVGPSREEIQARIKADADARFVQYMQQTLASIDQNARQRQQVATLPDPPAETNFISPESATNRQFSGLNRLPTVLERVYIPVYQPPRPASQPSPLPLPPPPSSSDVAVLPPPPPLSNISLPPPPGPAAIAPKPISLPTPVAPDPPPVTSNATQTLVGILELGDRSAALFDIDGVTHRFRVGDNIGESGWTLVDISQQEAIVGRNGQLRSIYVGQKL